MHISSSNQNGSIISLLNSSSNQNYSFILLHIPSSNQTCSFFQTYGPYWKKPRNDKQFGLSLEFKRASYCGINKYFYTTKPLKFENDLEYSGPLLTSEKVCLHHLSPSWNLSRKSTSHLFIYLITWCRAITWSLVNSNITFWYNRRISDDLVILFEHTVNGLSELNPSL